MCANLTKKTLGCWCYPLPCHGDVLAILANSFRPMFDIKKYFEKLDNNRYRRKIESLKLEEEEEKKYYNKIKTSYLCILDMLYSVTS
jgi:Domain of unknown function (DUF4326)